MIIEDENLNIEFETTEEENFIKACDLCSKKLTREELFQYLKTGNLPERQYASLEIDSIESQEEAEILINNLTGCDGKIREAVAFRLSELLPKYKEFFAIYPNIFANATIDINANISRMVIDFLNCFENNPDFTKTYLNSITQIVDEAIKTYDGFIFRDKKYTINKQLFKIYWCLEGIYLFFKDIDIETLKPILEYCIKIPEYTIREKVAMILSRNNLPTELVQLKQILANDPNYYVKNQLKH